MRRFAAVYFVANAPLGGGAGRSRDARGFRLLARAGVLVQGALLDGLVDLRDQLALLFLDRAGVARLDRRLQAPEVRLHGAGQQSVLGALALAAKYPLFL